VVDLTHVSSGPIPSTVQPDPAWVEWVKAIANGLIACVIAWWQARR
jgi:hypothetical protein